MEDWYYQVYDSYGSRHAYVRRDEAFDFYRNNNGIRIETVTKDLFPTIEVIVDEEGFNIERIRQDLTIKETSEAMRRAIDKYDKKNTKQISLKLNLKTDADILAKFKTVDNVQGYIKELIRKDLDENY